MYCDDIRELMSARVDGVLDPAGEKRLTEHLAVCGACRLELAALQRLVEQLHDLPSVAPPPDLAAKISARIRRTQQPRILAFLSLPQTRVMLAASLLIVVTTLGIRQMYATRPMPIVAPVPVAQKRVAQAPAPVVMADRALTPTAAAPKPAEFQAQNQQLASPDPLPADAVAANGSALQMETAMGKAKQMAKMEQASARGALAKEPTATLRGLGAVPAGPAAAPAAATPGNGASRMLVGGAPPPAQAQAEQTASALPPPAPAPGGVAFSLRRAAPDGYTFRAERLEDALAIINRYAGAQTAKRKQFKGAAQNQDKAVTPQSVVMDISLPPAQVAALVAELQQAGAVAVSLPVNQSVAAGLAGDLNAASKADAQAAGAPTPATNILVRFTFLPPER